MILYILEYSGIEKILKHGEIRKNGQLSVSEAFIRQKCICTFISAIMIAETR